MYATNMKTGVNRTEFIKTVCVACVCVFSVCYFPIHLRSNCVYFCIMGVVINVLSLGNNKLLWQVKVKACIQPALLHWGSHKLLLYMSELS